MSLLRCARWTPRLPHRFPRPLVAARYSSDLPGWDPTKQLDGMLNEEPEDDLPPPTGEAYDEPNPPAPRVTDIPSMYPRTSTGDPVYKLYVQATKRNTIMTFTRPTGHIVHTISGGAVGFKNKNRGTMEAGHQCAVGVFKTIREMVELTGGRMVVQLYLSGFGNGREALVKALTTQESEDVRKLISVITDKTPIKIGGVRAMKARRL